MTDPDPIALLRKERADLFDSPPFWRTELSQVAETAGAVRKGRASVIGKSAGGREIFAFSYGIFEPQRPTATISSAMASDRPQCFFDPAGRTKPVLVIIGCIHGGETEGIAACMNLVELLEHGADLRGRRQDELQALLSGMRMVIVPCLNPDGRRRAGIRHLSGAEVEHIYLVQQGTRQDGSLHRGRSVKEVQPIPKGFLRFMGGYYNDAGVNLQHDDFFGPQLCPENGALRELFRKEIPDAFLTFHGHGAHASLSAPDAFLSPGYQRKQSEAAFYILSRLAAAGIKVHDPAAITGPPWSFYFQTFFHHATGALPLLCELPQGIKSCYYPLERILDAGLLVTQAWLDFGLRFGFRPTAMESYGTPPPA